MGTHATIRGGGKVITSRHDGSEEGEGMIFVDIARCVSGQSDARERLSDNPEQEIPFYVRTRVYLPARVKLL